MRMNETINTMPEYERLRADYEKRLQEVEQNYQKQLIQMADEAKRANMAKTDFLRRMSHDTVSYTHLTLPTIRLV